MTTKNWTEYWEEKWKARDIGFHQSEVEPVLVQHFANLTPGKVLVPLCGKTLDMIWLKSKGWSVVGVELTSAACEAFFEENGLSFSTRSFDGFAVYEGDGIEIWCGDLFDLPTRAVTGITAIYDRAALIALPEALRSRYMAKLSTLAPSKAEMLILAIEYPQDKVQGPPFSVTYREILEHYGEGWSVKEIARMDDPSLPTSNGKFKGISVVETAYVLKRNG